MSYYGPQHFLGWAKSTKPGGLCSLEFAHIPIDIIGMGLGIWIGIEMKRNINKKLRCTSNSSGHVKP